ncbi:tRNA pseudouridine(38-40) synthase TruA [Kineothrix sp. MB12-C1]|uniref:tRNA pseudouridine(38-40) synthase TruA n=1 Tax=Kineothrix sp. MB12-C1 TaxID=3070215 RepID=UPI0027D325FB|nr:tRNA pseudouridine(38-40) synthase TruA [Kineothrix sp. MB12-C1]WMC93597.1 tRNA pseudouridine(38-40) synthase TruA [Kineothrix sp. MB12-C1]
MRNIKVILQYEGTKYQGWQKQEGTEHTIQGKLEALLTKMCGDKVEVHGSGRTDAGVHALCQVANFHIDTDKTVEEIMEYMNNYLPEDIAVIHIQEAAPRFHSRLNAKGKTYCYRVLNSKIPHIFDRRYVHEVREVLDVAAMEEAAKLLCGTHDYKAFTSNKKGKKQAVRTVESIDIEKVNDEIRFTFKGNGFLYHMVRIMMGTLLEVGMHKREAAQTTALIASKDRKEAGMLVPAKGLTLVEVHYS